MAAVDQNRQADAGRPSQIADRIQGGAYGPAGEQDVVDQHDLGPVDIESDLGAAQHGPPIDVLEIVAVKRDVDRADVDILPEQPSQLLSQPLGQGNAARSERPLGKVGHRLAADARRACGPSRR